MKLLITGASGYLGRRLCQRAERRHLVWAGFASHPGAVAAGRPLHLDFLRPRRTAARIRELSPAAIIHAAAINPGGREDEMAAVNVGGSRLVAAATRELGARLLHVSTDVVHDGRHAPYADDAPPSPVGLYARTKAEAEAAVLGEMPAAVVVRTSLIYGLDAPDNGTAGFAARLEAGEPVRLFADVLRQPMWTEALADALLRLVESAEGGFFNIAGSQVLSRDQFGRKLLAWWNVPHRQRVETVRAGKLGLAIPLDLRLRLERARTVLGLELPGVDDVLDREEHRRQ